MKSVLISIQPKWCEKIASGEKTIEVRKSRPKLETPFKCYIYMTKNGSFKDFKTDKNKLSIVQFLRNQGKVIGEFVCDRIDEWKYLPDGYVEDKNEKIYYITSADGRATCLTYDEIENYGKGKTLYGWHISDLKIYDKLKELSEFKSVCKTYDLGFDLEKCCECEKAMFDEYGAFCGCDRFITRPPQSYCRVESLGE